MNRMAKKTWLKNLYSEPNKKIVGYSTSTWTSRTGDIHRDENTVLLIVEGTNIYIQVEDLFDWIEHYRTPKREYGIGECDSEKALSYSILLEFGYGIPRDMIRERITLADFDEIDEDIKSKIGIFSQKEEKDSDGLPVEWKNEMQKLAEKARESEMLPEPEVGWVERTLEVNIDLRNIDLSQLDTGEIDSVLSSEDEYEEGNISDYTELPYMPGLHSSNNEFEAIYMQHHGGKTEDDDNRSECSDTSEGMADMELNPIEALGIDLIDPSRDNTQQPSLRRIELVWDPGGGIRKPSARYRKV